MSLSLAMVVIGQQRRGDGYYHKQARITLITETFDVCLAAIIVDMLQLRNNLNLYSRQHYFCLQVKSSFLVSGGSSLGQPLFVPLRLNGE
jgi:hypothetical protein